MQTMIWPDELRPAEGLAPQAREPRRQEAQMAETLMEQLTTDFCLEEQRDRYRHGMERVVAAKEARLYPGIQTLIVPAADAGPPGDGNARWC